MRSSDNAISVRSDGRVAMDSQRRPWLGILIALAAAGMACRAAQYLSCQSIWADEAALLLNIRQQPMARLPFVRLDATSPGMAQASPPLFLWATKWMADQFNYREFAVRLLPLACSLLSVLLMAHLSWRLLSPAAAAWAIAMFAFSEPLIFQSATVKQYSGDAFVAVLIVWVAFAARPGASATTRLALAAVVTCLAQWLSFPAVFAFAAVALALWPELAATRGGRLARMSACALPAAGSLLALYFLTIRAQRTPGLDASWIDRFPNWSHPLSVPGWLVGRSWELYQFTLYPIGAPMILIAAVGIWFLARQKKWALLVLLTAPVALNLLAACISQYPYGGTRVTIFLIPFECLLAAVGAAAIAPGWGRAIVAVIPAATAAMAVYHLFVPLNHGNFRDALAFLNVHRRNGEPVYLVGPETLAASLWFLPKPDDAMQSHFDPSAPIFGGPFWVVLSYDPRRFHEMKPALSQPNAKIDEARSFHTSGADVIWFAPK